MDLEFKGTKGQWKLQLDKALFYKIKIEPDLYIEIDDGENTKSGVLESNAKLIAAAPDLLKACISIIKWADDLGYENDFTKVKEAVNKALK